MNSAKSLSCKGKSFGIVAFLLSINLTAQLHILDSTQVVIVGNTKIYEFSKNEKDSLKSTLTKVYVSESADLEDINKNSDINIIVIDKTQKTNIHVPDFTPKQSEEKLVKSTPKKKSQETKVNIKPVNQDKYKSGSTEKITALLPVSTTHSKLLGHNSFHFEINTILLDRIKQKQITINSIIFKSTNLSSFFTRPPPSTFHI